MRFIGHKDVHRQCAEAEIDNADRDLQQLERYLHPHRELALEAHSIDVGRTILSAYLDDVDAQRHPCCWRCEPS